MAELEQALRDLPRDPALAPEPLPAIAARAARRRRRRRWQGGLAGVVATAAVLAVALAALVDDRPEMVSTAGTGTGADRPAGSAPRAPGAVSPTTTAGGPDESGDTTDTTDTTPPPTRVAAPTTVAITPDPSVPPPSTDPGTTVPATTTTVPVAEPELSPCPTAQVAITTATESSVYAPGETVRGWSSLRNDSGTTCLLSPRAFFRIEDQAGRIVGSFANTADIRPTARAEPGHSISSSFTWDQKDCSGLACVQVPAGTYTAIADWTEGFQVTGTASFQIGS